MKLFDTEYRIEIYNERNGEWESKCSYSSIDDALESLQKHRKTYSNSIYRLCELTISVKVIDV